MYRRSKCDNVRPTQLGTAEERGLKRPLPQYYILGHIGMHYIEGGWPGSNPKDVEFFERAQVELPDEAWAKVVAFGR